MEIDINKLIEDTLSTINIPCKHQRYTGKESTYVTYFVVNKENSDYSDDKEEMNSYLLQIDFWSKEELGILINKAERLLKKSFEDVKYRDLYEDDTKKFHIAFSCYFYEEKE